MSAENPEGKYEDSYMKLERLIDEWKKTLGDIRIAWEVYKKDLKAVTETDEKCSKLYEELCSLESQKESLEEAAEKLGVEYKREAARGSSYDSEEILGEIMSNIQDLYKKILDIQSDIINRSNELDFFREESLGAAGDAYGSRVVFKMEHDKLSEIMKEILKIK